MPKSSLHFFQPLLIVILSIFIFFLFGFQEQRYAGTQGVPLDDSWIHFQFARNVAEGNGFSYNSGERTPGSTSPLWVYILAGIYRVTHEFIITSKILGLLFLIASAWFMYTISMMIDPDRRIAFFVALFTVFSGRLFWGALSGMEIGLFTLLTVVGIYLFMKHREASLQSYLSTFFVGLATLARPEGVALFLFTFFIRIWLMFSRDGEQSSGAVTLHKAAALGLHLLIFGTIVFPEIVFCLHSTGRPLPNTFYAKTHGIQLSSMSIVYLVKVTYYFFKDHPLLFCALPFGLWRVRREIYYGRAKTIILLLWFVGFPILNAVINPITWHHGRYFMFLIPLFFLFSIHGIYYVGELKRRGTMRFKVGVIVLSFFLSIGLLFHWSRVYAQNADNINQMDVRMGRWLEANLPQDAVVAASDVGAIAFFSARNIIDTDGLITSEIIPLLKKMGRQQGVFKYLQSERPDFVVAFYNEFQFLTVRYDIFEPVFSLRVTKNTILGGDRMVVYKANWSSGWRNQNGL